MNARGFSLIELMIAVAIVGILAAIALPNFGKLLARSQEGVTKGNLASLRSALTIYYADAAVYPTTLDPLLAGDQFPSGLPVAYFPMTPNSPGHLTSRAYVNFGPPPVGVTFEIQVLGADYGGAGRGWGYEQPNGGATKGGRILPLCGHNDINGNPWIDL